MFETETYPQYFFFIFGIIGIIFLIWRPQYSFWMGIFYFAAREIRRAVNTRIGDFGPFVNLDDFIIIIMILSLLHFSFKYRTKIPTPTIWILISLGISILLVALNYNFSYPVLREFKWALYFPIGIYLGYNFITEEKNLATFLKILFIGTMVSSITYIFLVQNKLIGNSESIYYESLRSVFFVSLTPSLVAAGFYVKMKWFKNFSMRIFFLVGISLFVINLLLSQTRSYYIAIILTVTIIYLIRKEVKLKSILIPVIVIPLIIFLIFDIYLGYISISELIFGRVEGLKTPTTDVTTISRLAAIDYEFNAFLMSNIIFGNGVGFSHFTKDALNPYISWGHIGHIAYLARLGLLGFFIYSILIPFISLHFLYNINITSLKNIYSKMFIIFAFALVISDWIQFWMSSSYLHIYAMLSGIVIGTIWSLKDKKIKLSAIGEAKLLNT